MRSIFGLHSSSVNTTRSSKLVLCDYSAESSNLEVVASEIAQVRGDVVSQTFHSNSMSQAYR